MSSVDMHPARILGEQGGFYIRVLFPKELLEHRCGVLYTLSVAERTFGPPLLGGKGGFVYAFCFRRNFWNTAAVLRKFYSKAPIPQKLLQQACFGTCKFVFLAGLPWSGFPLSSSMLFPGALARDNFPSRFENIILLMIRREGSLTCQVMTCIPLGF